MNLKICTKTYTCIFLVSDADTYMPEQESRGLHTCPYHRKEYPYTLKWIWKPIHVSLYQNSSLQSISMATQRGNEEHMSLYRIRVHRTVSDKNGPVPSKVDATRLCKTLSDKSRPVPSKVNTARFWKTRSDKSRPVPSQSWHCRIM